MDWRAKLAQSLDQFWTAALALLPDLLVSVAVLAVGVVAAVVLRRVSVGLTARVVRRTPLGPERSVGQELRASGVERVAAEAVGHAVFWLVLLMFLAIAAETLGLEVVSTALSRLVRFLPSVLAAVLVLLAGTVLARMARRAVTGAATTAGVVRADLVGEGARLCILAVTFVIALDQIGIESTLLILSMAILLGTLVGSMALAFALGARDAVRNAIAAHYVGQRYRVGDRIRLLDQQGRIIEFTRNAVLLDTPAGRALVPAGEFDRATSVLVDGGE